ncbi:MAG: hypothetical protein ACFFED_08535 [Candidatus Thorarchaeota archaeon]
MQTDSLLFILIWWGAPLAILFGRSAIQANKTRKKRIALRELEERITPVTREL